MSYSTTGYAVRLRSLILAAGLLAAAALPNAASGAPPAAGPMPVAAPDPGCVDYFSMQPRFRWGYFGATVQQHPRMNWHRDYNGDLMRWEYLRR